MKLTYEEILALEPKIKAVIEMAESQAFQYINSPEDLHRLLPPSKIEVEAILFAAHQLRKNLAPVFDAARIESL